MHERLSSAPARMQRAIASHAHRVVYGLQPDPSGEDERQAEPSKGARQSVTAKVAR